MYGSTDGAARPQPPSSAPSLEAVLTALAVLALWACMVTQQMLLKDTVSVTAYGHRGVVLCPYPLFVTGTINGIAAAICFALLLALRLGLRVRSGAADAGKLPPGEGEGWTEDQPFTWRQFGMLLLTGIFEGLERGLQNKAFQFLGVATRTMLCSTGIVFTMAIACTLGLEAVNPQTLLSVLALVLGGGLQGVGMKRGTTSVTGLVCVLVSLVASASRWATVQLILQRSADRPFKPSLLTKLKMVGFIKPMDCMLCLMMSQLWERANFNAVTAELVRVWFVLAAFIVCISLLDIVIVSRTSAVALGVVFAISQIPMVTAGVVLNKEAVTTWQVIGFAVCLTGALVYFHARARRSGAPRGKAALLGDGGP